MSIRTSVSVCIRLSPYLGEKLFIFINRSEYLSDNKHCVKMGESAKKITKKVTQNQKEILINFLEEHPELVLER